TAKVTSPAGLDLALGVDYENNVDAGTATGSASYAASTNYLASNDSKTFTIAKAATTTVVTCTAGPFTYTGTAHTPCTAKVTSPAGLDLALDVDYAATNVDAGAARAYAGYEGDLNHEGSTDSKTFTIAKAATTTVVTCTAGPFTYTGAAYTPCSAKVSGPAGLDQTLPVTYANNVHAGTATGSASYAASTNYLASNDSKTYTIGKATPAVSLNCPTGVVYDGAAHPCTAAVQGIGAELAGASVAVTYTRGVSATTDVTSVGTVAVLASFAGSADYTPASKSGSFTIAAWTTQGFYQPVDMGSTVLNTVKAGSTVPLKFELFSGSTELTSVSAVKSFGAKQITCGTAPTEDAIEMTTTGGTNLRYDTSGGQFIQNWQTPKATVGTCYQVTMTALDDSKITAYFKLK
ncbi:PxKF domain-containing protein, partial [Terracoccus sp. 273MFTsu3.1]|uniref:PxKF domain-containing protein n=1 Tax=Terracoccus sp. 273MFTsu3.1 TaxID=1172188 RepID=UPI00048C49E4